MMSQIRVGAFEAGETVVEFPSDMAGDYGFVVSGNVFFLGPQGQPLGVSLKDEFFLTRPFALQEKEVKKIIAADPRTFIVFVPRAVVVTLAQMSASYAHIVDEIYEAIFDRARVLAGDEGALTEIKAWINHGRYSEIQKWLEKLEKKRADRRRKRLEQEQNQQRVQNMWWIGLALIAVFTVECVLRFFYPQRSLVQLVWPDFSVGFYEPGSTFNIGLGVVGFVLLIFTNAHTLVRYGIRKWRWKVNYQVSQQLHIFLGVMAFLFVLLHSSVRVEGLGVANLALISLIAVILTGAVGQFIANQIPKTLQGDRLRLEHLSEEKERLRERVNLIVHDPNIYKTSMVILQKNQPKSAIAHAFLAPFLWLRSAKLKKFLKEVGLGDESAKVASRYMMEEFMISQRIHFLEVMNRVFKRWMIIHLPMGYAAYFLALVHVVLETLFK